MASSKSKDDNKNKNQILRIGVMFLERGCGRSGCDLKYCQSINSQTHRANTVMMIKDFYYCCKETNKYIFQEGVHSDTDAIIVAIHDSAPPKYKTPLEWFKKRIQPLKERAYSNNPQLIPIIVISLFRNISMSFLTPASVGANAIVSPRETRYHMCTEAIRLCTQHLKQCLGCFPSYW